MSTHDKASTPQSDASHEPRRPENPQSPELPFLTNDPETTRRGIDQLKRGALNPATIMQLQRAIGNRNVMRLLNQNDTPPETAETERPEPLLKPDDSTPVNEALPGESVQRHILGAANKDLWATEIAAAVSNEGDDKIKDAVLRLHSVPDPVIVTNYQDLVERIQRGDYEQILKSSRSESPDKAQYNTPSSDEAKAIAGLIGSLSDNYGSALSSHPLSAQLWSDINGSTGAQKGWKTKGVIEVMNMFLFLYTNADTVAAFFNVKQNLTPKMVDLVESLFKQRLGATFGGQTEHDQVVGGKLNVGNWFKEGLDAVENTLKTNQGDSDKIHNYVTDNLNNETKNYYRKLIPAKEAPMAKGQARNISAEDQFTRAIQGVKSKDLFLETVYNHMMEKGLPKSIDQMWQLVQEVGVFAEKESVVPDESDVQRYMTAKLNPEPEHDARVQAFPTLKNDYEWIKSPQETAKISQQDVMGWLKINDFKAQPLTLKKTADNAIYQVVGKKGMLFLLKKTG